MRALDPSHGRVPAAITASFLAVVVAVASLTAATDSSGARKALAFGFAHVPRVPTQALSIFANNLLLLCVPLAMAILVQASKLVDRPGWRRLYIAHCDLVAIAPAFKTAIIVGVSIGAYRARMLVAMLPAGPVEVAAFTLAGTVYVHARRHGGAAPACLRLVALGAVAVAALAVAAALEALA
jgi:hypothetical protein